MKRVLIINADDLGYTHGVNRSVAQCYRQGILTSATLMANGPAFEDAIAMVKDNPALGVGIHLVLTELQPLSRPDEIPGLLDKGGRLLPTPGALLTALLRGKVSQPAMHKELARQVSKVLDYGLTPTHLDSHMHVHVLPQVFAVVLDIAQTYGIQWVRNPFEQAAAWRSFPLLQQRQRLTFCKQYLQAMLVTLYRSRFFRDVRRAGLRTPDHMFGIALTGIWSETAIRHLLSQLPPGINELMVHPGVYDEELRQRPTRLHEARGRERDLLLSASLKDLLQRYDITLSRYGEEVT
ncbi:MAG: ChbG/HpnK family deacetylase [Nitrospinae bacterium]|nr:ChbG/HpnK family deacetylase [Nitrospinota bacterium]